MGLIWHPQICTEHPLWQIINCNSLSELINATFVMKARIGTKCISVLVISSHWESTCFYLHSPWLSSPTSRNPSSISALSSLSLSYSFLLQPNLNLTSAQPHKSAPQSYSFPKGPGLSLRPSQTDLSPFLTEEELQTFRQLYFLRNWNVLSVTHPAS